MGPWELNLMYVNKTARLTTSHCQDFDKIPYCVAVLWSTVKWPELKTFVMAIWILKKKCFSLLANKGA